MLHLSGERDYDELRGRVSRPDYILVPFLDDFGAALGAADLVVARAGGSVWEIAAAGKPCRARALAEFATGDHQAKNAALLRARRRRGVVVLDRGRARNVPPLVEELLADPVAPRETMSAAMRAAAKPDAADKIADELVALAAAHR